ncbi:MAG: hypothetical protein M1281_18935, partial [Chloroflexi bacterium]|nr:hypothetical protein [Chloroflexota bacterium]
MTLTISTLISFVAFSIYSVLLGILVSRGIRSHLHRTFAFYLASMVLWSFGSLALFSNLGLGSTVFWNRFMLIGYLGMPVAFFVFVQAFLHRYHRSMTYLGYIVYAAILVANAFGLIIQSAYLSNGELHNQYGLALYLSAATWTIFIGYSAFSMLQEYRRTKDSLYRNRIRYLLVVILTIFAGSVTNATPLRFFPVDILFNVFSALLMSYAIQRHQLLDVSVVIRKGLLYSIPTVLISASYFLIISLSVSFFGSFSGFHIFLLSLFVAILTALITQPVRDKVQFWIDRLFFREKYDTALMLQRISRTAASVLDIQQLTLMLLTEVASTLHLKHADFFLRDEDTGDFYLTSQVGLSLAPTLKFKASHPVVKILSERENALTYREIELMPQSKGLWEAEEEDLKRIGAEHQ